MFRHYRPASRIETVAGGELLNDDGGQFKRRPRTSRTAHTQCFPRFACNGNLSIGASSCFDLCSRPRVVDERKRTVAPGPVLVRHFCTFPAAVAKCAWCCDSPALDCLTPRTGRNAIDRLQSCCAAAVAWRLSLSLVCRSVSIAFATRYAMQNWGLSKALLDAANVCRRA